MLRKNQNTALTREQKIARYLALLREGTPNYEMYMNNLRRELRHDDTALVLTLEQCNSSEEELKILRRRGAEAAVLSWADRIREGDLVGDEYVEYVRGHLFVCGRTLSELGCPDIEKVIYPESIE